MAELTPEERQKIYEEEKARAEAKETVEAENKAEKEKAAGKRTATGCMGCLVAVLAMVVVIVIWTSLFPGEPPSPEQQAEALGNTAFIQCQNYVRDALVSPATADFPFLDRQTQLLGNNSYRVISYVDSQNALGATLRTNWICDIQFNGGDEFVQNNWTLIDLQTD